MNLKKIIREEIGDFDWVDQIDPYSFVKQYYEKYDDEYRVEKMLSDYAHLRNSKKNIYELINKFNAPSYLDVDLLRKALIKYYKKNLPFIKRFLSRFSYDDLKYVHNQIIDAFEFETDRLSEEVNDFDWIRDITPLEPYTISSEPNLYIDDSVVQVLGLPDYISRGEKDLGSFSWTRGGITYKFTAKIYPIEYASGKKMWRVIGASGDYGFGYSWITKRNTLGKRARMEIFKQIIDRYNLDNFVYES